MFCSNCGNSIREGAKFCEKCGVKTKAPAVQGNPYGQQHQQQPPVSYPPPQQQETSAAQQALKPKKKKKKGRIVIIAILLIAALFIVAAILGGESSGLDLASSKNLISTKIPAAGGMITVNDPASSVNGLTIDIQRGSYSTEKAFDIKTSDIKGHSFGSDFTPVTPLISVNNGGEFSSLPIRMTIPVKIASDEFAMAFYYDKKTAKLEALPLENYSTDRITLVTNHFSDIVVSKIKISDLRKLYYDAATAIPVDTGFAPGVDDWQFVNYGSAVAPGGHCAGQSLTMAWYYFERFLGVKDPRLHGRFDNNSLAKTASFWQDDSMAYKFASVIQIEIDWNSLELEKYIKESSANQAKTFYAFAYAMHLTSEPQFMGIYSYDSAGRKTGGHAIVAYKLDRGRIYVADPNYPGQKDRYVEFTGTGFLPYSSGANAADISQYGATLYREVIFAAKTALINFDVIEANYSKMLDGTIGEGSFPLVQMGVMKKYDDNPDNMVWEHPSPGGGEIVLDSTYNSSLPEEMKNYAIIAAATEYSNFAYTLYEGTTAMRLIEGPALPDEDGTMIFVVPLNSGISEYGILVEQIQGNNLYYTDFKRIRINYTLPGTGRDNLDVGDGGAINPKTLVEGQYVEFGAYYGQPILWQIVQKDNDRITLFSKDIIGLKAFDANGDKTDGRDHIFAHRRKTGSNFWEKSNLREWLNSDQNNVSYSHLPPESSRLAWNKDGYAHEPGFLSNFDADEKGFIVPVTNKTTLSHPDRNISTKIGGNELLKFDADITKAGINYDNAYYMYTTDKVFLLSIDELKRYVFQKGIELKGYLTKQAVEHTSIIANDRDLKKPHVYWLRTPIPGAGNTVWYVDEAGNINHAPAYGGAPGIRPALCIAYSALRYGNGTLEDPYRYTKERKAAVDVVPVAVEDSTTTKPTSPGLTSLSTFVPSGWGNTSANILSGGLVAKEGEYLYYYSQGNTIVKIKSDGTQKQSFSVQYSLGGLNVKDGNIYYPGSARIEVIKKDGSIASILDLCHNSKMGDPRFIMLQGDWLYYWIKSGNDSRTRIYKIKTDGSNRTKLEQFDHLPVNMVYGEDGIYYLVSSGDGKTSAIYKVSYEAKGLPQQAGGVHFSNSQKIADVEPSKMFTVSGKIIYYFSNENIIYRMNVDGSSKKKIGEIEVLNIGQFYSLVMTPIYEIDTWLYVYAKDKGLVRIKIDGSQKTEELSKQYPAAIFNNDIYYFDNQQTLLIMDLDGKNKK